MVTEVEFESATSNFRSAIKNGEAIKCFVKEERKKNTDICYSLAVCEL